jgi:purine-binding chemotaxis protein CheW
MSAKATAQTAGGAAAEAAKREEQLVTMLVGGHLFGLPIHCVQDVFVVSGVTAVPRANRSVHGLINLRGRIVTLLSLAAILGLEDQAGGAERTMAVGVDWRNEAYGLMVDRIGDVLTVDPAARDSNPANIERRWHRLAAGIHKMDDGLLIELDADVLLDRSFKAAA